jgi:hypothetical protein
MSGATAHLVPGTFDGRAERSSELLVARPLTVDDLVWAIGGLCVLKQKPFDAELRARSIPPPYSTTRSRSRPRLAGC